ncbi:hypothetical protein WR25_27291 [Diploscapter pachys]|uniref:Uncharacterized protein n=1 Tax=Diploscapter pachys TaxID=2018661 RepID=A0A2A2KDV9_9BILA|nr:hypothetical protein WR25_27291 [Diploscapter pachys]
MSISKIRISIIPTNNAEASKLNVHPNGELEVLVSTLPQWNQLKKVKKKLADLDITLERLGEGLQLELFKSKSHDVFSGLISKCSHDPSQFQLTEVTIHSEPIPDFVISGPNLQFKHSLSAGNLTLISTQGRILFNSRLTCKELRLVSNDEIRLSGESFTQCDKFVVSAPSCQMFLEGKVYSEKLHLDWEIEHLYISIHGALGRYIDHNKVSEILYGQISGVVSNFGQIVSRKSIDLKCRSIEPLDMNNQDTAIRGYSAYKGLMGVENQPAGEEISASTLKKAFEDANLGQAATLLENGVDLDEQIENETSGSEVSTPRKVLKSTKENEHCTKKLSALVDKHEWRRGSIQSKTVHLIVDQNLSDCAQIVGEEIQLFIGGNAICESDSIWKNPDGPFSLKMVAQNLVVQVNGQVKLNDAEIFLNKSFAVLNSGTVAVEKYLHVDARNFETLGLLYIGNDLRMKVEEMAKFHRISFVESKYFKLHVGNITKVLGHINAERLDLFSQNELFVDTTGSIETQYSKLQVEGTTKILGHCTTEKLHFYSQKELIAAHTGTIECQDGQVLTKNFVNCGKWSATETLELSTEHIVQEEIGEIKVGGRFELRAGYAKEDEWLGIIMAKNLTVLALNDLVFSGQISAENASISLFSPKKKSTFTIHGLMQLPQSPLFVDYFSKGSSTEHPALIISGQLFAQALYADPVYTKVTESGKVILHATQISAEEKAKIMLSSKCLETEPNSLILCETVNDIAQRFICKKFIHEGILLESSTSVMFIVEELFNKGSLLYGNENRQFSYLVDANFYVGIKMRNEAELIATSLKISGNGSLENLDSIYAQSIDIRLNNVCNKDGKILGTDVAFKLSTPHAVSIGGNLFAENTLALLALNAETLDFSCTTENLGVFILPAKVNYILTKHLRIHSHIKIGSNGNSMTTIVSNGSIKIYNETQFTLLVLKIQDLIPKNSTERANVSNFEWEIAENGQLFCQNLRIKGICKQAQLNMDGKTVVGNMQLNEGIDEISLSGSKSEQTIHQVFIPQGSVRLGSLSDFQTAYVEARRLETLQDSMILIRSPQKETQLRLHESIIVNGLVKPASNIVIIPKEENLEIITKIHGSIVAQNADVKCYIKAKNLEVSGQIQKLNILETHATSTTISSNGSISDVEKFDLSSGSLEVHGQIERMKTLKTSAPSTKISSSGTIREISEKFDLESEWLTHDGKIEKCPKLDLFAWGAICNGKIENDELELTSSLVFVNTGHISSAKSTYASPFMFNSHVDSQKETKIEAIGQDACIAVKSLVCLSTESQMIAQNIQRQAVLSFNFATAIAAIPNTQQLNHWKNTVNSLNERFSKNNPSLEEIQQILQMTGGNLESNEEISIREQTEFYTEVRKMVEHMHTQGIVTFSVLELVEALMRAQNHFYRVNLYKEHLLAVPKLAREFYKKGEKEIKFFLQRLGFKNVPEIDPIKGGIQEVGMWCSNAGLIEAGSAGYCAYFIESYSNAGTISSTAGDINIQASKISQAKGRMIAAYGSILLQGDTIAVTDVKSAKQLLMKANEELKAKNIEAILPQFSSKQGSVQVEGAKTEQLSIQAKNDVNMDRIEAKYANAKAGENVHATNIKARTLTAGAIKNVNMDRVTADYANVKAGENLDAKDIKAELFIGDAQKNLEMDRIEGSYASAKAGENVHTTNIKAGTLTTDAIKDLKMGQFTADYSKC